MKRGGEDLIIYGTPGAGKQTVIYHNPFQVGVAAICCLLFGLTRWSNVTCKSAVDISVLVRCNLFRNCSSLLPNFGFIVSCGHFDVAFASSSCVYHMNSTIVLMQNSFIPCTWGQLMPVTGIV